MTHPTDELKSTETLLEEAEDILCHISDLARVGAGSTDAQSNAEDVLESLGTVFDMIGTMSGETIEKIWDAKADVVQAGKAA
ncbi:MAG: hypothetical protein AAGA32_22590 [Pseudomonadota bacterium]